MLRSPRLPALHTASDKSLCTRLIYHNIGFLPAEFEGPDCKTERWCEGKWSSFKSHILVLVLAESCFYGKTYTLYCVMATDSLVSSKSHKKKEEKGFVDSS